MSIVHDCFRGNKLACVELYFWANLWPRIRQDLLLPIRVTEPLHPDWDPYALDSIIAVAAAGPNPEPAIQLQAMTDLRDRLVKLTKELDTEIKALREQEGMKPIP